MIGQDRRNEGVMKSYPEQVEAYRDLIPIGPLSVAELVEKLKSRLIEFYRRVFGYSQCDVAVHIYSLCLRCCGTCDKPYGKGKE